MRFLPAILALSVVVPAAQSAAQRHDFDRMPKCQVLEVSDGDTVLLQMNGRRTTVRLVGVDTPETVHPAKMVERYGPEASRFLANLLLGEEVYFAPEPAGDRLDKYQRTLGYLYRVPDGLFVNLEIVRQGYGRAYTEYPFEHAALFRRLESRAREAGKGLWAAEGTFSAPVAAGIVAVPPSASAAPSPLEPGGEETAMTVYVTRTGTKYHRAGCPHIAKGAIRIPLAEAKSRYQACEVCGKG